MTHVRVLMYREADGSVPFLDWFDDLPEKVQDKCLVRLERLAALGRELRRAEESEGIAASARVSREHFG